MRPSSDRNNNKGKGTKVVERDGHDVDIGGVPYVVMVENLEKGISPLTIMKFINEHISITCQVQVLPSKLMEAYTRGTITVDSKKNLDKLCEFLESQDHYVISSRGRPWVITEKRPVHEIPLASIQAFTVEYKTILQSKRAEASSNELKVALSGTEEYEKAKLMKDLFMEFIDHDSELRRKLLRVEVEVVRRYGAV